MGRENWKIKDGNLVSELVNFVSEMVLNCCREKIWMVVAVAVLNVSDM